MGPIRRNQKQQKVGANPPLASRGANQLAGQTQIVLPSIKTFEDASAGWLQFSRYHGLQQIFESYR